MTDNALIAWITGVSFAVALAFVAGLTWGLKCAG